MGDIFAISSVLLIVIGNIWHGILLSLRFPDGKPHSISEHAAAAPGLLLTHRIIHTALALTLIGFGAGFLLPNNYLLAGWVIIGGGVFDFLEVMTLNKDTAKTAIELNPHTATAWLMASCFLLYALTLAYQLDLGMWLFHSIWVLFLSLMTVTLINRLRDFWIMQMIYFVFLGLVIALAHIKLLAW